MTYSKEPKGQPERNGGMTLLAVAIALGAVALAADLTWMTPNQPVAAVARNIAEAPAAPRQDTAAQREEPTIYFPAHFTLQAKEPDAPVPTF